MRSVTTPPCAHPKSMALMLIAALAAWGGSPARGSPEPRAPAGGATAAPARPPLGVSYSAWRGGYADAEQRLATYAAVGFPLVSFVPAYAYVGRNRIDVDSGPSAEELGRAVELALRAGRTVVIKPHLEPLVHRPGYRRALSDNHSWRAECGWRGFFDLDPLTPQYRDGVVLAGLRTLAAVNERLRSAGVAAGPPVRFELGAELMNSVVEHPDRWEGLLRAARAERRRLGLDGRVLLSHNFSHHLQIPEDQVERMDARRRKALARYLAGLDALAVSQYMDLTVAVPAAERAGENPRLPTADEVATALRQHEAAFRRDILQGLLGLRPAQIPPLHLGEFGVGQGGLKHPNLWGPLGTPADERRRAQEIALGHQGLVRYLGAAEGRTAQSATLWVTGTHYDIFGWRNPAWATAEAAAAIRGYLAP